MYNISNLAEEGSPLLPERSPVEYDTNSSYDRAQNIMPKINSSSVKNCESSRQRLAQKFSFVTRAARQ